MSFYAVLKKNVSYGEATGRNPETTRTPFHVRRKRGALISTCFGIALPLVGGRWEALGQHEKASGAIEDNFYGVLVSLLLQDSGA